MEDMSGPAERAAYLAYEEGVKAAFKLFAQAIREKNPKVVDTEGKNKGFLHAVDASTSGSATDAYMHELDVLNAALDLALKFAESREFNPKPKKKWY
jgi:hypothetical protein